MARQKTAEVLWNEVAFRRQNFTALYREVFYGGVINLLVLCSTLLFAELAYRDRFEHDEQGEDKDMQSRTRR